MRIFFLSARSIAICSALKFIARGQWSFTDAQSVACNCRVDIMNTVAAAVTPVPHPPTQQEELNKGTKVF